MSGVSGMFFELTFTIYKPDGQDDFLAFPGGYATIIVREGVYGKGKTPQEAIIDLCKKKQEEPEAQE